MGRARRGLVPVLLRAGALACRACAIALVVLVALLCLSGVALRPELVYLATLVTDLLPSPVAGLMVLSTPLGGAFRGDFAIVAVALLVLDWLLARLSWKVG